MPRPNGTIESSSVGIQVNAVDPTMYSIHTTTIIRKQIV